MISLIQTLNDFDRRVLFRVSLAIYYLFTLALSLFFTFSFVGVPVRLGSYHSLSCSPLLLLLVNICFVFF